jgi:hypothetical protein
MIQTVPIHINEIDAIHFYDGVDPTKLKMSMRACSAGGVPGRRLNLMVFLNRDIINGLFFILQMHVYFHMHIFRNNCQNLEHQTE